MLGLCATASRAHAQAASSTKGGSDLASSKGSEGETVSAGQPNAPTSAGTNATDSKLGAVVAPPANAASTTGEAAPYVNPHIVPCKAETECASYYQCVDGTCAHQTGGIFAALSGVTGVFFMSGDASSQNDVFGGVRLLVGSVTDGGSFNFVTLGLSFNGSGAIYAPVGMSYTVLEPDYYVDVGFVTIVTDAGYAANLGMQAGLGWLLGDGFRLGIRAEPHLFFPGELQLGGWLGLEVGVQN
jgi:hypothetical protein